MSKTTHREDHLKALYALGHSGAGESQWVSTNQMASHLGVKPPSVTAMVHVLTELGWAEHRPYHGARLTPAGEKLALALVRKHRLWETFLVERLVIRTSIPMGTPFLKPTEPFATWKA